MTRRSCIGLLLAFCVITLGCTRDFVKNDERFDETKWKASDIRERGRMTDDLLARSLLPGKLRQEAIELLGEPDYTNHAGDMECRTDPGAWIHGANNGPWIHYLHVDYDKQTGRVVKAYITD